MSDSSRFPQIPATVWWGVRSILQRTPNAVIDERLLGTQLEVQATAAKAYVNELRSVGVINDDGRPTPLAQKWRLDESYAETADEIVRSVYPEGLFTFLDQGDITRQRVVSWFLREGLGQGSAGNKAATFLLLSSPGPSESPKALGKSDTAGNSKIKKRETPNGLENRQKGRLNVVQPRPSTKGKPSGGTSPEPLPLNVNVQIHISADAGTEQIEMIFSAMKRYLYDAPAT